MKSHHLPPNTIQSTLVVSTTWGVLLITVMCLAYRFMGIPFVPFDLLEILIESNFLDLRSIVAASDGGISFALIGGIATGLFLLLLLIAGTILLEVQLANHLRPGVLPSLVMAALIGLPMMTITFLSNETREADFSPVLTLLWLTFASVFWSSGLGWSYKALFGWHITESRQQENGPTRTAVQQDRRRFLIWLGGGAVALVGISLGLVTRAQARTSSLKERLQSAGFLPPILKARIFPSGMAFTHPEQSREQFNLANRPIGVCFPGGGGRAAACAIGQTRGLIELGLWDKIGAISCVSGGAVFGAQLVFAPENIPLSELLGPILAPSEITLENLEDAPSHFAGSAWSEMTGNAISELISDLLQRGEVESVAQLYTHILRHFVLTPLALDAMDKFIALDDTDIADIIALNPGLHPDNFYTTRSDAPYYIVSITHVYPTGQDQVHRHFEFTPMVVGTSQRFVSEAPGGIDFGGGYLQTFAFNSEKPTPPDGNIVQVDTPSSLFSLSDLVASSSAAPGLFFDQFGVPNLLPHFNYWPIVNVGHEDAVSQSFTDGAALENFGIIPLLRRQYPIIIFFANTNYQLGESSSGAYGGMDNRIAQLFGIQPDDDSLLASQNLHVFPTADFDALSEAMLTAHENGQFPIHVDSYSIIQPNAFDIPPYPGDGKVTVVWMYNNLNRRWFEQLSEDVLNLLDSRDPANSMERFPNFKTIGQNTSEEGVLEVIQLTAQQVNLLAHMWCYTITEDAANILTNLV